MSSTQAPVRPTGGARAPPSPAAGTGRCARSPPATRWWRCWPCSSPWPGRVDPDRGHRRGGARGVGLRLRPARRLPPGDLGRGVGRLHRAVPRRDLQHPGRDLRPRHPPADGDAEVRRAADRGRSRCRPGVPCGDVQHRRPRPDARRRRGRRLGRLPVRPALAAAPDPRDRWPACRRSALGRDRGRPQGPHRGPRGDRHDHAQLRRLLPRVLRAVRAEPVAGPGLGRTPSRCR